MKNPKYIILIIVILVVGVLAYLIFNSGESMEKGDSTMKDKEAMMEKEDSMEKKDNMLKESQILAGSQAKLYEFSEAEYASAKLSDKLIVLYFYANWCPICREEFPKMQSAFDELSQDNIVGFRVSFKDDETSEAEEALAREFGVAYQHTKVFIKDGRQILKAPDSWSKERYLEEINKTV